VSAECDAGDVDLSAGSRIELDGYRADHDSEKMPRYGQVTSDGQICRVARRAGECLRDGLGSPGTSVPVTVCVGTAGSVLNQFIHSSAFFSASSSESP
jgi:hypothetical protein